MDALSHHSVAHDKSPSKRKDRPPALDIVESSRPAARNDDHRAIHDPFNSNSVEKLRPSISTDNIPIPDPHSLSSRSTSATSSLDPYYFSTHSPSASPIPPLPDSLLSPSRTPDTRPPTYEPTTPHRDPSTIDRRGLHGLGELATPRWTRSERYRQELDGHIELDGVQEEGEPAPPEEDDDDDDEPDSPWTIEAIDGESEDRDEASLSLVEPMTTKTLRVRRSMAEESGGEEILYPRQPVYDAAKAPPLPQTPPKATSGPNIPPSAFVSPMNKPRKRTSDEFELDHSGALVAKRHYRTPSGSLIDKSKEDKGSARKHRSLGVGLPTSTASAREKQKDRRRESVTAPGATTTPAKGERHSRHTSASSSSSSHVEMPHSRRVHTTDFSHLPPSPSTSSIQQFLRHAGSNGALAPSVSYPSMKEHHSPNVAHSLLRGTQEGWSDLDDQATAEALRKLDGLSGKSGARVRSSVGSLRPGSSSRPGTPAKSSSQWEGVSSDGGKLSRRNSTRESVISKDKDQTPNAQRMGLTLLAGDPRAESLEPGGGTLGSSDEAHTFSQNHPEKVKKSSVNGARLSLTGKRGSASSTTYTSTPTTSSRDSASLSATTSATSVSAQSGRYSTTNKARRNSGGSDMSASGEVASLKDRAALLATSGEPPESSENVPPVPPLPKDLAPYRSPPTSSAGSSFPVEGRLEKEKTAHGGYEHDRTAPLDVPGHGPSSGSPTPLSQNFPVDAQGYMSTASAPAVMKTPSKKWSFTNALGMKLSGSPSARDVSGTKSSPMGTSPRSATFSQPRRSDSRDRSAEPWSPIQPSAMASAASLASQSSLSSAQALSPTINTSQTPDRHFSNSRPGTASSAHQSAQSASLAAPQRTPLSPSGSSMRRGSSKRLTPSSIPFFRRSSSHSMHAGSSSSAHRSTSPTTASHNSLHVQSKQSTSPIDSSLSTPSVPTSAHKKSSMLGLGSLLKGSSSKRNLQADDPRSDKESRRGTDKEDTPKTKKDDKDRSESRISVLMGRRRGKTVSATDQKKPQPMSALPPATAQRLANMKAPLSNGATNTPSRSATTSNRATSQTVSSLQRQSDNSLRSRTQLPTIAGSPSVGTAGSSSTITKEMRGDPLSSSISSSLPKETPTKIPRIHSRTSTVTSPALKASTSSQLGSRRTSLIVTGQAPSTEPSPTLNEFGVMDNPDSSKATIGTATHRQSIRGSPSTGSRVPRQASQGSTTSGIPRKGNRDSMSFGGLRKSSTSSVASVSSVAPSSENHHHRFSALSPSKGLKLLSPKVSLAHSRTSNSASTSSISQAIGTPSSSRQSLSTPSPSPSSVDDEELLGDEEMLQYIKRQQQKKIAHGATQEELDELLRFPERMPPISPSSPSSFLKSSQKQHLSDYERQEILDYPSVYYVGANSEKKMAHPDRPTNNFGYDDERGDYLIVNHDHLAYRYEVLDVLGKGSFGQVLGCRDHCTGQSVAIKIIRNKKRFHHQALVEIKILDNLRKWDSEEKHHVIKMTEHFYFRNHLCIAMELLSINLYELIKANGFVGFTTALIRRFTSQMLMSLTLMRHHRIVHCDLKPENVLLRHPAKSAIKVIDFGSSCLEHEKIYTYIQSRFYRSPEVILGMNYHMAIDMWSLGCIMAELKTGFPIFPGENEQEQLSCIMEVLGVPDKEFVNRSSRKRLFFDSTGAPRPVVNSKGRRRRPGTKSLAQVLRCDDEQFIDFIAKCLVWDPERRIKPQNALRHPFILAGKQQRGSKVTSTPSSSGSKMFLSSSTSRSKPTETPKKSQISAPAPLTARSARTTTTNPTTPSNSSSMHSLGSARSYRTSQAQQSSGYHSSRTLNGFSVR
ncbi:hypothetical protein OF83DRAFT_1163637 [Amylostereum chailletii]|nr:hypothetical protein OF83DRAFT_1163637 [Amylostereum chailletii]